MNCKKNNEIQFFTAIVHAFEILPVSVSKLYFESTYFTNKRVWESELKKRKKSFLASLLHGLNEKFNYEEGINVDVVCNLVPTFFSIRKVILIPIKPTSAFCYFVTAVKDKEKYKKNYLCNFSKSNNVLLIGFDNCNGENTSVSRCYNFFIVSLLSSFSKEISDVRKKDWVIFCHDDLKILRPISLFRSLNKMYKLNELASSSLYTFLGACDDNGKKHIVDGNTFKGISRGICGCEKFLKKVETADCMSLVFTLKMLFSFQNKILFDERLAWHLYVEDFCIRAKKSFNLSTYVFNCSYVHQSDGEVRFDYIWQQFLLSRRHRDGQYWGTCGLIGKRVGEKHSFKRYCFYLAWMIWATIRPRKNDS